MSCTSARERRNCSQEVSRVLLVCIYDTVALDISNQLVYDRFCKFGPIVKILIFDKGEVTKLFIQFHETDHAQQAKKTLDGTKLLGAICRMNIYYSNFTNVDLKNETSQGADFRMYEQMNESYSKQYDALTKGIEGEMMDDMLESAFKCFPARAKTDDPKQIQRHILQINSIPHSMINEEEEVDHHISNGILSLLEAKSNSSNEVPTTEESATGQIPRMRQEITKNSVIGFPISRPLSIRHIYNLFSNFGNISFICLKKSRAYIKFRTVEFSAMSYSYLNDHVLMGNRIYLQSPCNSQEYLPQEEEYCECIYYDYSYDRFTANRSITVNCPSQTLHVSSLKKEICREQPLINIFSTYGKVEAVRILCQSNEKNMALVKFNSMESSFNAIAELHNELFNGRKMQISFTKSKV